MSDSSSPAPGASARTAVLWAAIDKHAAEMKSEMGELRAELSKIATLLASTKQTRNADEVHQPQSTQHKSEASLQRFFKEEIESLTARLSFKEDIESLKDWLSDQLSSFKQQVVKSSDSQSYRLQDALHKEFSEMTQKLDSIPAQSKVEEPVDSPVNGYVRKPGKQEETTMHMLNGGQQLGLYVPADPSKQGAAQLALPDVLDRSKGETEPEEFDDLDESPHHADIRRSNTHPELDHLWYNDAFQKVHDSRPLPYKLLHSLGCGECLPDGPPDTVLARIVGHSWFYVLVASLIIINTAFIAYVDDQSIRKLLLDPPEKFPEWWDHMDFAFSIVFLLELLLRLAAYRVWFFIAPVMWTWNMLDIGLVSVSFISGGDSNVMFFRMLRILRLTRMGRLVKVMTSLGELRKLLHAVFFGMVPLFWTMLFIFFVIFLFSLLILRGVTPVLMESEQDAAFVAYIGEHFNSLPSCFSTLSVVVTGEEWLLPHQNLQKAGGIYIFIVPLFVIFVNVGVMNIVIGLFAEATATSKDEKTRAEEEMNEAEAFIISMRRHWFDFAPDHEGDIDWESFRLFFYNTEVQAFLYSHGIDMGKAKLIYELCDRNHCGHVECRELILAMLKLKGEAKSLDVKIILHAVENLKRELHSAIRATRAKGTTVI